MSTPDATKSCAENSPQQEKRQGFHPALVIATIVVVVFVLWFCPYALMNARISQTEANAAEILSNGDFAPQADSVNAEGLIELKPLKTYTDYAFFKINAATDVIYAVPRYYNRTARTTFCLKDGVIYKKNISDIHPGAVLPEIDKTWKE